MADPVPSRVLPTFANAALTRVRPLERKAHSESINPTILDTFCAELYVPVLFTYRLVNNSEAVYSQAVKIIRESLQTVLIPYFSFAGRWVAVSPRSSNGGGSCRKLLCNDEGVPFIEAYMDTDLDLVVEASASFQPVPELHGYDFVGMDVTQFHQELAPDGAPPIFVQITRFNCGGLALGVTFNHMHVDAKGFFNFMTAWSRLSRDEATIVTVDHDRGKAEIAAFRQLLSRDNAADRCVAAKTKLKLRPWASKCFEISASTIKFLKQEAAKENHEGGGGYISTGDCIVAHLWKSLGGILPSPLICERQLVVSRIVEGRSTFYNPPLRDFCGNVFTLLPPPEISIPELLEMPVASIASRFRASLEDVRREEWLGVEMCRKVLGFYGHEKFGGSQLAVMRSSSWFNFPMYEVDFGFGKPYFAMGLNCYFPISGLGSTFIYPPIPSSSSSIATLHVKSTPELIQALESNPQFLPFFMGPR